MKQSLKRLMALMLVLSLCLTLLLSSVDAAGRPSPSGDGYSASLSLTLTPDGAASDGTQPLGGAESREAFNEQADADCSMEPELPDEGPDAKPDASDSSPGPELENPTQALVLRLTAERLELFVGENAELAATVEPEGDWVIQWKSSDEAVASVDSQGGVTAHQAGSCTITAAAGGAEASCPMTVKAPGLVLDQTKYTLDENECVQLHAAVEGPDHAVHWSSSDFGVASVNQSGLVSGIRRGRCIITASAYGVEARCEVHVRSANGTVLMLASDYQSSSKWQTPRKTLEALLKALKKAEMSPENAILCGDYSAVKGHSNHNQAPGKWIAQIKKTFLEFDERWDVEATIFVQGNHDEMTEDISSPGLHEYDDYLVYVLNAQSEYPSAQGRYKREKTVIQGAKRLEKCLKKLSKQGEKRPVFLAAHVPLHFTGRTGPLHSSGDNLYSSDLFAVINSYGKKLNLVYAYGHNHTDGWDNYMGGSCVFRAPGEWLLIPKVSKGKRKTSRYTKEKLNFTYLNAGYLGYYTKARKEKTLTCTICQIRDDSVTFTRYSQKGKYALSGSGSMGPSKKEPRLIPKKYYGKQRKGSYTLALK